MTVEDVERRELVPRVLSVLVRLDADFATAEHATQEALIRALSAWRDESATSTAALGRARLHCPDVPPDVIEKDPGIANQLFIARAQANSLLV